MRGLALVAAMVITSITLLTTFAKASYYGPSVVAALVLAVQLAVIWAVTIMICSRGVGCRNSHLVV